MQVMRQDKFMVLPEEPDNLKIACNKYLAMTNKKWSANVTEHSHALALEEDVFKLHNPRQIAESLKKSAIESTNRKGTPYQSAMSMLNFYMNRAGKNLSSQQKEILEQAKDELRRLFH